MFRQQFGETDDGKVDIAARGQRDSGEFRCGFAVDGAAFACRSPTAASGPDLMAKQFRDF